MRLLYWGPVDVETKAVDPPLIEDVERIRSCRAAGRRGRVLGVHRRAGGHQQLINGADTCKGPGAGYRPSRCRRDQLNGGNCAARRSTPTPATRRVHENLGTGIIMGIRSFQNRMLG